MAVEIDSPGIVWDLYRIERERLLETLRSLDHADWNCPTPCPNWSVLDIARHLLGGDLGVLSRQRDHYFGTKSPNGLDESTYISWIDGLQMEWVSASRRISPRLIVELLSWTGQKMIALFSDQEPTDVIAHVSWAGPSLVPVWLDQVRELSESWIHHQQIHIAMGREPDLRADLLQPILTGLRWAYPYRLKDCPAESGDTACIEITGAVALQWNLIATSEGWEFGPAPMRVVARLDVTSDEAWRLLTNNLSATQQETLRRFGNDLILKTLLRTRAIIGVPN